MKVVEKFVSINGEGILAGELAVFIRFKGCNLRCSYCDTTWANESECKYDELSPEKIYSYIQSTNIRNVTLTGGEPLVQKQMSELLHFLSHDESIRVEIETNGAIDLSLFARFNRIIFTMDYKLPSSLCEDNMMLSNFDILKKNDTVKFVIGSCDDLERAKNIITQFDLINKCYIYFSPVFGSIEPVEIVNYMIKHNLNGVRMQIQMHKVIWDQKKRGV